VGQLPAGHLLHDLHIQVLDSTGHFTKLLTGHQLRLAVTPGVSGASTSLVTLGPDDYQDGDDEIHFVLPSSTVLRAVDIDHGDGPGLLLSAAGQFVSNESHHAKSTVITPCSLRGDVAPTKGVTNIMVSFEPPLATNAEAIGRRKRNSRSSSSEGEGCNVDLVATALSNASAADAPAGGPGVAVVLGADHSGGFPNLVVKLRNNDGSFHVPLAETIEQGLTLKLVVTFAALNGKKNNTISGTHSFAKLSTDNSTVVFPALGNGSATGTDASSPALKVGDYKFTVTFTETREAKASLKGEFYIRVLPGTPARLAPKRKGMLSMLAASDRVNDDSGRTLVSSGVLALNMVDNGGSMVSVKSLSLLSDWASGSEERQVVPIRRWGTRRCDDTRPNDKYSLHSLSKRKDTTKFDPSAGPKSPSVMTTMASYKGATTIADLSQALRKRGRPEEDLNPFEKWPKKELIEALVQCDVAHKGHAETGVNPVYQEMAEREDDVAAVQDLEAGEAAAALEVQDLECDSIQGTSYASMASSSATATSKIGALGVRCRISCCEDGDEDEGRSGDKCTDEVNGVEGAWILPQLEGCDLDGWVSCSSTVWSEDGHEFMFREPLLVAAGTGAREGKYSLVFEVTGLPDSASVEPLSAPFTFSTDAARAEAEKAKQRETLEIDTKLEILQAQQQRSQEVRNSVISHFSNKVVFSTTAPT